MLGLTINAETVHDAWKQLVRTILLSGESVPPVADPLSIGSGFGQIERTSMEVLGATIEIANPRSRIVTSTARNPRTDYAIAQALWALSGSNELEPLAFYVGRGFEFSDDGRTIRSALGSRVLSCVGGNQLDAAVERINRDPSTRRALIQVYLPDDLFAQSRDIPCIGSLHLLARDGKLHAITQMRSQSALMVFPYDVFALTMIQEVAAVMAGLQLGKYIHICNSAHIYADEIQLAKAVATEEDRGGREMSPLTVDAMHDIPHAIHAERHIREQLTRDNNREFPDEMFQVGEYWRTLLQELVAHWKARRGIGR